MKFGGSFKSHNLTTLTSATISWGLGRMWRKRGPWAPWVGVQTGAAAGSTACRALNQLNLGPAI